MGCFCARVLPNKVHRVFGREFNLNPGPFNVKEHTIITMMTAAGTTYSYAIDILLAQEVYYGQHFGLVSFPLDLASFRLGSFKLKSSRWGFQILLILSTQAMGFGVAGVARRFLVWPSSMVWPANLVTTTVMHSLHNHKPADAATSNGWTIGRYKFFLIVGLATFYSGSGCLRSLLSSSSSSSSHASSPPATFAVNQVFGGQTGLGLLPISFDWTIISGFLNSPLQTPAFAIANVMGGLVFMTIGAIGLAWGGPEYYRYLPLRYLQPDLMSVPCHR